MKTPRILLLATVLVPWLYACDKAPNPVAPSGTILIATAAPSQISLTGQAARVTVTGTLPSGNPIRPGTQITLTASVGVLRPLGSACNTTTTVSVIEADDRGQAFAELCGDGRSGEATVTASLTNAGSGDGAAGSAMVTVQIGQTDASRPTLLVSANPTTVSACRPPNPGEDCQDTAKSLITFLGRASDGSPVGSGQRIRVTVDLGELTCSTTYRCPGEGTDPCNAVCTDSRGEAQASFTAGTRSGTGKVSAILGTSEEKSVDIAIRAAAGSLDLTAPSSIARQAQDIELEATVLDTSGSPLGSLLVRFSADVGTFDGGATDTTNSDGLAEATLVVTLADLEGLDSFTVTARATSEGVEVIQTKTINIQ